MKQSVFHALRWHLTLLACCWGGSALMLQQAWQYYTKSRMLEAQAVQQAAKTTRSIAQFQATEAELRQNIADFLALKARNIISEKKPTQAPDIFPALQRDLHITQLDHELSTDAADRLVEAGAYQVRASQLRLHMSLLHEAELLPVLHQLSERAPALLRLQECQLSPSPDAVAGHRSPLFASCRLDWITFSKGT